MFRHAVPFLLVLLALPLAGQDEPFGLSGSGELSFVSTTGNTDTSTIGVGSEVFYREPLWSSELKAAFVRSENEGEESARSLNGSLALLRTLRPRLNGYVRGTYVRNRFAGIDQLLAVETGVGWDVLEGPHRLRFEAGIGHTDERRTRSEDLSFASGRAGVKYRWKISEQSSIREELSVLTNLGGLGDVRVLNTASIVAALNARFSLKLAHTLTWVNEPVPGFESTDTTTAAAIVARWGGA